jgi:hypothetical protein
MAACSLRTGTMAAIAEGCLRVDVAGADRAPVMA